jgi:fatty acid-binding protein DegV
METFMRTTIDLPETLIEAAMKLSNQRTKTAVIVAALEDFVRKGRIQGLKKYRGKVNVDIDLNALRKRS